MASGHGKDPASVYIILGVDFALSSLSKLFWRTHEPSKIHPGSQFEKYSFNVFLSHYLFITMIKIILTYFLEQVLRVHLPGKTVILVCSVSLKAINLYFFKVLYNSDFH